MADVNVQREGTGNRERQLAASFTENADILSPGDPGSLCCFRSGCPLVETPFTSERVPVPTSELRKQAKPGGRSAADVQ